MAVAETVIVSSTVTVEVHSLLSEDVEVVEVMEVVELQDVIVTVVRSTEDSISACLVGRFEDCVGEPSTTASPSSIGRADISAVL